jgi:hypothetical protein
VILVTSEKFDSFYSARFINGANKGQQANERFESLVSLEQWADSQGFEFVKTICLYRQIEVLKGGEKNWYAFGLCGTQVFINYQFKNESHVKSIIDWHHNNA